MTTITPDRGLDARLSEQMREVFLPFQKGKLFTAEDAFKGMECDRIIDSNTRKTYRHALNKFLYNVTHELKKPLLKQIGNKYRLINYDLKVVNLRSSENRLIYPVKFPFGVDDGTDFKWDENITIRPGDILVIAGLSNAGKTTMCLNLLANNLDKYEIFFHDSEFNLSRFCSKLDYIDWVDIWKAYDEHKFTVLRNEENYEDAIQTDKFNIIDWVRVTDNAYLVGNTIKSIKDKLGNGIAVISMQKNKDSDKFPHELALGGGGTLWDSALYVAMDYNEKDNVNTLKVIKVKEPGALNLNRRKYTYTIGGSGVKFYDIKLLGDFQHT